MKINHTQEKTDFGTCINYYNDDNSVRFALYYYDDDRFIKQIAGLYADPQSTLFLSNLYVDEKYRKHGHGNEILDYVLRFCDRNGFICICLNVKEKSWQKEWYKRRGFHEQEDATGQYEGNVWMVKDLSSF